MGRIRKIVIVFILAAFFLDTLTLPVRSEGIALPPIHEALGLTPAYQPCLLRGLKLDPRAPFNFEFVLDEGDAVLAPEAFKAESDMLIRFFLAALTTPEKDIWVNLSPYENNRIVDDDFGRTTMGRELLAQDYILKQLTASLMHPDTTLGKNFWDKIYAEAWQKFGTTDIPVDTFNKVWIMPASAVVYEGKDTGAQGAQALSGFIDEARLKVMLETDYMAAAHGMTAAGLTGASDPKTLDISKQVVRDIILPALEKEVNEGKNFARLRQAYYSLLLAVWLKKKLQGAGAGIQQDERKANILSRIFVDRKRTGGIETPDPRAAIDDVYALYVRAFRQGAYNLIKEDQDKYSGELIPRKYFSGGFEAGEIAEVIKSRMAPLPGWVQANKSRFQRVSALLEGARKRLRLGSLFRRTVLTVMLAITPVNALQAHMVFPVNNASGVSGVSRVEAMLDAMLGERSSFDIREPGSGGSHVGGSRKREVFEKSDVQMVNDAVAYTVGEMNAEYRARGWGEISEGMAWKRMGLSSERFARVLRESWEGTVLLKARIDFPTFVRMTIAFIGRESAFDHTLVNHLGASGLLQMLRNLSAANLLDPETNIRATVKLWEKQFPTLEKKIAVLERMLQGPEALTPEDIRNRFDRLHVDPRLAKVFLDEDNKLNELGCVAVMSVAQVAGPAKSLRAYKTVLENQLASVDRGKKLPGTSISGFVSYVMLKSGIVLELRDVVARIKDAPDENNLVALSRSPQGASREAAATRISPLRFSPLDLEIVGELHYPLENSNFPAMRTPGEVEAMKKGVSRVVHPVRFAAFMSPLAFLPLPKRAGSLNGKGVLSWWMPRRSEENDPSLQQDNAASTIQGGIDLDTRAMDLRLRGEGGEVRFELTPAQVEMLRQGISGLVPVILDVRPMDNIPFFLGLDAGNGGVPIS